MKSVAWTVFGQKISGSEGSAMSCFLTRGPHRQTLAIEMESGNRAIGSGLGVLPERDKLE